MEFKGTKGKWEYKVIYGKKRPKITVQIPIKEDYNQLLVLGTIGEEDCTVASCCCREEHANALLISKAPEMLDIIEELCENLSFQLDRLGVCGEGDGKGRKADVDSYGGTELLQRAKQLIKEATEL